MLWEIVQSILPGTRSLRSPIISGILWAFLAWYLLSEFIPLPAESTGWARQVYAAAAGGGPIFVGLTIGIGVFVIGALATVVADAVAYVVGAVARPIRAYTAWQFAAQRSRYVHLRNARKANRRAALLARQADRLAGSADSQKAQEVLEQALYARQIADSMCQHYKPERTFGPLILSELAMATGFAGTSRISTPESQLVDRMRWLGIQSAMSERGLAMSREDLDRHLQVELFEDANFVEELRDDPVELVRFRKPELFNELDRQRAEQEVRLLISVPVLVASFSIFARTNIALGCALAAISIYLIIAAAVHRESEKDRVVRLLRNHDIRTPALDDAFEIGRSAVFRSFAAPNGGDSRVELVSSSQDPGVSNSSAGPQLEEPRPRRAEGRRWPGLRGRKAAPLRPSLPRDLDDEQTGSRG